MTVQERQWRRGFAELFVAVLCAATASVAAAQGFPVAGRVVDALTGSPLARATVSLEADIPAAAGEPTERAAPPTVGAIRRGDSERFRRAAATAFASVVTGTDGHFQFGDVAPGRYRLLAARRGYLPTTLGRHGSFFNAVVVGSGATGADAIRFAMQPMASIRGTIEDSTGDPVLSANVALFSRRFDGEGTVRSVRRTFLGQNGSTYRFDDLPPGTYYVAVSGRPWFAQNNSLQGNQPNPLDVVYPTTFWDGAATSDAAMPIVLRPGDTADASFSLHAVPAVHISLPMGQSGSFSFSPTAFGAMFPVSPMMSVNSVNGTRTLKAAVAPGNYVFDLGGTRTSVDVAGDSAAVPSLAPAGDVSLGGELAMAAGGRLPQGVSLVLEPADTAGGPTGFFIVNNGEDRGPPGLRQRGRNGLQLEADANGMLHSLPVPPGDYRLAVDGGDPAQLVVTAAAAQGGTLSADLILHVDTQPVMLAATVAEASSAISGTAPGAGDAMILLVPDDPHAATLYRQTEAATNGTWSIENVVPGKYRVLAVRDGWDLDWKTPETLAKYMPGATSVMVASRSETKLPDPVLAQER